MLVTSGVQVEAFTFPFVHRVDLGDLGGPLTVFALVLLMNVVNFSDGIDGLAAGVCAISARGVLDHRVRPRPQHGRHPGRDHLRRRRSGS